MIDFEVQRCTRHCAASGRELKAGDTFYSVLVAEGSQVVRHDYAAEAWQGPPATALGWWKSQMPERDSKKMQLAPNDVMLELLERLAEQPQLADMRYVLSLLLVRRRVLRLEQTKRDQRGREISVLHCPRLETSYEVITAIPNEQRTAEIQEQLSHLLFAPGSTGGPNLG